MLRQRVITALFLVAALASVLFLLPAPVALLAFALVSSIAAWEWAGLMRAGAIARRLFPVGILLGCLLLQRYAPLQPVLLWLAAGFWLLLVPVWFARRWSIGSNLFGYLVGTLVILPAWVAMSQLYLRGPWVLIGVMALVWIADIAAYFVGRAVGRHKLAPTISPGKTWEGAVGAVLGGLIYGAFQNQMAGVFGSLPWYVAALVLTALVAVSIIGDLFESMVKRQANVKDSSGLLPGHGGVLDRIDSLTAALPLAALGMGFLPL
jgi:phosphatidate cytidylyltransferase